MQEKNKAVRKKETRSEREKRKYDAVVKATYDTELARRLRGWSDARIYKEYGIKTTRRVQRPDLKKIEKQKIARKQREWNLKLEKYRYLREKGLDPEASKKYKTQSWAEVKQYASIRSDKQLVKQSQWERWSAKKTAFPPYIMKTVETANKWYRKKFPKGEVELDVSRWGFAVAWYVHVAGYDFDMALEAMKPSEFDSDIYQALRPKPDSIRS